jgi:hypothetical protein
MEGVMRAGYSVTVSKDGEAILTIEREMVAGKSDLTPEDEAAIRDAGEHLMAFAGPEHRGCFVCGGIDQCKATCELQ